MKITLEKVEYSEAMSEETPCFCADVYAGGVKLGTAHNSGQGGATCLYGDFKALHDYAKTLPSENLRCGDVCFDRQPTADSIVEKALYRHLHRKDMKRKLKKYTLLVKNGKLYRMPLNGRLADTSGYTVLNDLAEEKALDLYIENVTQV